MKSIVLFSLAAIALPATAQRFAFGRADYPLPMSPALIATGDFNHDGRLDVAVGMQQSTSYFVSVLLGKADGSFSPPGKPIAVPGSLMSIAAGDFNADGNLDLAVGNFRSVSILLGNGDGTFAHPHSYPTGKFPGAIAVADFNGDGKSDLAIAALNHVSLLLGNGDGTFQPELNTRLPGGSISLVAGDFNHDGQPDLFVIGATGSYSVLLNKGGGKFAIHTTAAPITDPWKAVAVDLNHDGNPDIVMIGQDQQTALRVAVLLGDRRGAFHTGATYNNAYSTIDLVTADFNHDGHPDVAVALEDGTVNIYYGDGHGAMGGPFVDGWGGVGDFALAAGDFTGGGNQDLALVSGNGTPSVTVLLNKGDGTFVNGAGFATDNAPAAIASADLNADGIPDLAIANFCGSSANCITNGSLSIQLGNGDGSFQPPVTYPAGGEPTGLVIADFNNDGIRDIAVSNFCMGIPGCANPGTVAVYLGKAGGAFQPPVFYTAQVGPNGITAGDFNGDGKVDLAVANGCGTSDSCTGGTVLILQGNGDGTFTNGATLKTGKIPKGILAADFNHDGNLDLVVSNNGGVNSGDTISLFLGRGDGTFKAGKVFTTASSPAGIAAADFNGDGNLDIAVSAGTSGFPLVGLVSVLLGDGKGGFQPAVNYPTSLFPGRGVVIGDFDSDGNLDLAVSTTGAVALLRGNGDGTFQAGVDYPQTASSPTSVGGIVAGDWNGDGGLDLATVNGGVPGLAFVLLNPPAVALSPESLPFVARKVGTSSPPRPVNVTNSSGTPLTLGSIGIAAADFSQTNDCPPALAPGAACTIQVRFQPTVAGRRTAKLVISSDGLGSPQSIALSGTGR